ncbi:poly-gamma-glutamate biosynthesis protein PgsC/CapC [Acetomicrobium sp.]|uniref:poly-gamma-glutamate biosynthesis protein PgsC/CapC n=1 Tax=Acetomicrobium sp. TaxID=1872099 RepID=UPI003D99422B
MRQDLIIIALSIILGMIFYQRTGVATGGIISPGLLAIRSFSPQLCATTILNALIILFILEALVRIFGLYGRQRISIALLLAVSLRLVSSSYLPWIGWVVPGLIAADMQRQGVVPTVLALLIVSGLSVLVGSLFYEIF